MSRIRTYLDWNATAPLRPQARAAMVEALDLVGNPSSVHTEGRRARRLLDEAREKVARLVGAEPDEVVFTSGASEANTAVIMSGWNNIVTSDMEHDSVLASVDASGADVIKLPVVAMDGDIDLAAAAHVMAPFAVSGGARRLLSVQLANQETGILQPLAELVTLAKAGGYFVHTDATQACGRVAVEFKSLGVDYLTLSSHKLGGPKGTGALVVRNGAPFEPLVRGGGQEYSRRAGTENIAAIAGFGAAADGARQDLAHWGRIAGLRDRIEADAKSSRPDLMIAPMPGVPRLPNTLLLVLPNRSSETLVAAFDLAGIAVSAGSACSSGKVTQSRVLRTMGYDTSYGSIRVSLGLSTTDQDAEMFARAWGSITSSAARAA